MRVIVYGRLRQRSYETKEGEKRTVYEIEVDDVGPSLRNASAKVNKVARSGSGDGGAQRRSESSGGRPSGGQGNQAGRGGGGGGRPVGDRRSRRLLRRTAVLTLVSAGPSWECLKADLW